MNVGLPNPGLRPLAALNNTHQNWCIVVEDRRDVVQFWGENLFVWIFRQKGSGSLACTKNRSMEKLPNNCCNNCSKQLLEAVLYIGITQEMCK